MQRRRLLFIGTFIVFIITIVLSNIKIIPKNNKNKDNKIYKSVSSFNNLKQNANQLDNWICFGNLEDNKSIYKITKDGKQIKKLCNGQINGFLPLNEYIYYKTNNDYDEGVLKRIRWNGEKEEIISDKVRKFITNNRWIFFEKNKKIYRCDKDGSNIIELAKISNNIYDLKYYKNYIYFSTSKGIFKVKYDGTELKSIINDVCYKFYIEEDKIIFNNNNEVKQYYIPSKTYKIIMKTSNNEIYFNNNILYFSKEHYLYSYNIKTKKEKKLFLSIYSYNIYISGEDLFCFGDEFIWKIKKDLSKKQIIFGLGNVANRNTMSKYNNSIIVKSFDYENFKDDKQFIYYYNIKENSKRKLINNPVTKMYIKNNFLYYVNDNDKKLYRYNLKDNTTTKLLDVLVSDFVIEDNEIWFSRYDDNYNLYKVNKNQDIIKLTNFGVYNLQIYNKILYYINRNDNNYLYAFNNKKHKRIVKCFITQYCINQHILYYRNESLDGQLYAYNGNKSIKLTEKYIDNLSIFNNQLYYIISNETNQLYRINNVNKNQEFVKFMSFSWFDYLLDGQIFYEAEASETGGINIKQAIYNNDLKLYTDNNLTYESITSDKLICCYNDFIYELDKNLQSIILLYPYPINKLQIDNDWIYITGDIDYNNYKSYIKRINLFDKHIEDMVESDEKYTLPYEFEVLNGILYYILPNSDNKLYAQEIRSRSNKTIVDNCLHLFSVNNNIIIYKDKNHCLYSIGVDDYKKKKISNEKVKFISLCGDNMFYFHYTDESFNGEIMSFNIRTDKKMVITKEPIKEWNYVMNDDDIYYLYNGINKLSMLTGNKQLFINENVDYFYIENNELIAYRERNGKKIDIRKPISK